MIHHADMPSGKRREAPSISGNGFKNPRDLSTTEFDALLVPSFQRATETVLQDAGWNGGLYGAVGLQLSNDNRTVAFGQFCLFGRVVRNSMHTIAAAKFWPGTDDIKLELQLSNATMFSFTDSLASNLVDSHNVEHRFLRDGNVVTPEELADLGINGFCLRAYVTPSRETYAKIALGLMLLPLADLLDENPLAENPLFPAISAGAAGEFPLGPPLAAAVPRARDRWGAPFWPLIVLGASKDTCPNQPSGTELRGRMAEILRKAFKPELKNGPATLHKRWDELREAGASNLKRADPEKLWPLPAQQSARG